MSRKHELMQWLNNAYAIEVALERVLENHAKDAAEFPEARRKLSEHLEDTREHARRLRQAIESAGENVSTGKAWIADMLGRMNAVSTGIFKDELVKNTLADFAAEQFEIASYKALIVAAEELAFPEVAEVCRRNLRDEEDMAQWLEQNIPQVTRHYLRKELASAPA